MTTALRHRTQWMLHALGPSVNPLRRPVDRISAATTVALLLVAMMAVPAGIAFGSGVHDDLSRKAARSVATSSPVAAKLVTTAPPVVFPGETGEQVPSGMALAQWETPGGGHRSATIVVPGAMVPGTDVTVWVDPSGRVQPAPDAPITITYSAVLAGLWAFVSTLACCVALVYAVWRLADLYALRQWQQEWEMVQGH